MHFWLFHLSLSFCDVGNTNFTSLNNSLLKINLVLSQIVERFVCQLSSRVAIAVIAPFWLQGIRSLYCRQRSRFPLKCATFLHHPRVFSGLLGFIVDAATEEAPELPKCEHCGHAEAEQPGCILICKGCSVESNDWRDASAKHKCEDCCGCRASSATKRLPAERNTRILPRWESTAVCRRICTVPRKPARSLVPR